MSKGGLNHALQSIIESYRTSFEQKEFVEESSEADDLMLIFGLTQKIKSDNKQYWGRELGMCWQRLIVELFSRKAKKFGEAIVRGTDELSDLVAGKDAIDTKYRIGSGDSGTLKKFKQYGADLTALGYRPVMLILRDDNLNAAIAACKTGGWKVYTAASSYSYINEISRFDLEQWLKDRNGLFAIK